MFASIIVAYLSLAATVIVAGISISQIKRSWNSGLRLFFAYFIIAAFTEMLLYVLSKLHISNLYYANIFCWIQFALIGFALISWIYDKKVRQILQVLNAILVVGLGIYLGLVIEKSKFDPIGTSLENVIITLLSGYLLFLLSSDTSQFLFRNYKFWFVVAVFIYFTVNSIVFATANFVIGDNSYLRKYTWIINSALTIIANVLFIKGLICIPKTKT